MRDSKPVQSKSALLVQYMPFSAGPHLSAAKIASHDVVLQSTAPPRDSLGSHFSAGIVIWQRTAVMRNNSYRSGNTDMGRLSGPSNKKDGEAGRFINVLGMGDLPYIRVILRI